MFRLVFAHGDQTYVFPLTAEKMVVGSSKEADMWLPVSQVSRRHAEVFTTASGFRLRDLSSRNGTFVDGVRVEEAKLVPLQEFSLGPVVGMVEEIATADQEQALWVGGSGVIEEPQNRAAGVISVTEAVPGDDIFLRALVTPTLRDLLEGVSGASAVRRAGARLAKLFPGVELELASRSADEWEIWFSCGCPGEAAGLRRLDLGDRGELQARWVTPTGADPEAVARAVTFVAILQHCSGQSRTAAIAQEDRESDPATGFEGLVAASSPMLSLIGHAHRLAPLPINLLVLGESGTGKELLARAVHQASDRRDGPFVAVNCAALPRDLLEVELFGIHEKVATGVAGRSGRFEQAHLGTLFLDEVCDMALPTQAMILRVLQEGNFFRIGGSQARVVDVRVVAATNKDVEFEIAECRFRSDLYYRLAGDLMRLPPLRERPGDIPLLVQHFVELYSRELGRPVRGLSRRALDLLVGHSWPGNVRELENEVRRALALAPRGGLIEAGHLSAAVRRSLAAGTLAAGQGLVDRLAVTEQQLILQALAVEGNNVAATARRLKISRPGLYQRIERLGIEIARSDEA